jgi:hypothetical protein
VLQSETWSLSGGVHHWLKGRSTREERKPVTRNDDDNNNNNNNLLLVVLLLLLLLCIICMKWLKWTHIGLPVSICLHDSMREPPVRFG